MKVENRKEWRCKNMVAHFNRDSKDQLPVPCRDCRTVEIVEITDGVPLDLRTVARSSAGWIIWDESFRKQQ